MANFENEFIGLLKVVNSGNDWEPPVKTPMPLMSVDVKASVVHAVAQVEVTQVYVNMEEQPIEAIYYFPVDPEGAVTNFQAELEGKIIKGTVKPHEKAKEDYNTAVQNQTTAFLGEETKADIFKLRVGFLKPGAQAKVVIGYVTEVKNEPGSNAIRFYIPTTIAPRYVSPSETDDKAKDIKAMTFAESSPAPLSLKVAVSLQGIIKSIESPTHSVKVDKTGPIPENPAWEKATVELSGKTTDMDRDFVLNILPEEVHKPRLYSEKLENGSTAVMLHLLPSFKLDEQKTEILFVLDRSGSMSGQSIQLAKKALMLFLHSLPMDCYFNVVGFGSTHTFLFSKSAKYDDGSLKKAIQHAKDLNADLGGTEILEPLKDIYGKPSIDGYLRQIFILTDGAVSNTDGVIGIAKANAHKARVFALGIGDGASHYLVEGIAKAGGGTSAFVTYNESINKKVLNQLKNGLQPSLTDIELEWEGIKAMNKPEKVEAPINKEKTLLGYNKPIEIAPKTDSGSVNSKQSPKRIPPVYDGSQLLVFGLFKDEVPTGVSVKAQSPDGPLTVKIEHSPENHIGSTNMLHRLAAVKLIRELELEVTSLQFKGLIDEEEKLKKEIIEIGCQNGITSKYTSFVAVDVSAEKPLEGSWVMETRHVPSQYAHGWHDLPLTLSSDPMCYSITKCRKKSSSGLGFMRFFARSMESWGNSSSKRSASMCASTLSCEMSRKSKCQGRPQPKMSSSVEAVESDREANEGILEMVIRLQSFDGSYTLDEKLCTILKKRLNDIRQAGKKNNLEESVLATALAISFFTTKLAAEKDVWDLIVAKARKWLAKKVTAEKSEEVIQIATNLL